MRSISDVVAEILLILVVLGVGTGFLAYYLYYLSYYNSYSVNAFNQLAYLVPVMSSEQGNYLVVAFHTGPYGISLYQVLVNSTPASCTVELGQRNYTTPVTLPAYQMAEVYCPYKASSGAPVEVTLVTNSGEYEVMVSGP
ncbi:MAG: hypothetical protein L7G93_00710 [Acidilobus sp.]|nr:hypothetical protein [Acidilobus sp.]